MKRFRFIPFIILIGFSLLTYTSCVHEPVIPIDSIPDSISIPIDTTTVPTDTTGAISCDTTDVLYSTTITSIMNTHCTGCHSASDSRGGIRLDTYDEVKKYVDDGSLYGSIAYLDGFSRMPRNREQLPECEIEQVKTWVDAGAENN